MNAPEARDAATPKRDMLRFFADTVRVGRDPVKDPSSLANNLIVMQILEAAHHSAVEGRAIPLTELSPI